MDFSILFSSTVFIAGILSFFSPCIFPVLPVYLGLLLDQDESHQVKLFGKNFNWLGILKTFCFILRLSTVFIILGYGAGFLGNIINASWFRVIMGVLIIVLGIHQMEIITLKRLLRQKQITFKQKSSRSDFLNAFVLGLTFSFGWTPCVGPVLSSVLGLAATGGSGAVSGGLYMVNYAIGLSLPFLLIALTSSAILNYFNRLKPYMGLMKKMGGFLIIIMGILIMTDSVNNIISFFETFLKH